METTRLLLEIYESAQHGTPPEFHDHALLQLEKVLPFDSAAVAELSFQQPPPHSPLQAIHLYRAPTGKILDRPQAVGREALDRDGALGSRDFVLRKAFARRGCSVIADLTQGIRDPEIARYLRKYETSHSLTYVGAQGGAGTTATVALWRARRPAAYTGRDAQAANRLLPHLLQAKAINQRLSMASPRAHADSATLFATHDGWLQFAEPQALRLLQLEWREWVPPVLPAALLESLRGSAQRAFAGRALRVQATLHHDLLLLSLTARTGTLTPAERRVALLAAEGLAYKEIARRTGLAAATVRNQLHAAYGKLGVANKTELALALRRAPDMEHPFHGPQEASPLASAARPIEMK